MASFVIEGGKPLCGEVRVGGNKNSILPMIAASLLTEDEVVLSNVPRLLDVEAMCEVASSLGTEATRDGDKLRLRTRKILKTEISEPLASKTRTSLLFAGPLLTRAGTATIWPPGGDVIGRRRLDAHFYGLKTLGADIVSETPPYKLRNGARMRGRELFFDEASVTATEHIMTTACLAEGRTIIMNAAAEPHVCDLGELLRKMGARISGLGTNTITVHGVDRLSGAEHKIHGDHIEAGSFLALAAATGGAVKARGCPLRDFWMTRRVFERFGATLELRPDVVSLPGGQRLLVEPDFGNAIPIVSDGPWPQYPTDLMSCTIVMATQARGTVLFFEKMFESRMYFVDRLVGMGANAVVCDPHRVVISGPATLRGVTLSSPDIRSGMAMVIAALCAKGTSVIQNIDVIDRGYEGIERKIESLGGRITRRA